MAVDILYPMHEPTAEIYVPTTKKYLIGFNAPHLTEEIIEANSFAIHNSENVVYFYKSGVVGVYNLSYVLSIKVLVDD